HPLGYLAAGRPTSLSPGGMDLSAARADRRARSRSSNRARLAIDLLDAGENAVEPLALALVGEPVDVLEQEAFRLRVAQHAQVGRQRVGAGIVEPHRVAAHPVAQPKAWLQNWLPASSSTQIQKPALAKSALAEKTDIDSTTDPRSMNLK